MARFAGVGYEDEGGCGEGVALRVILPGASAAR